MARKLSDLEGFPEEASSVGRMLTGYGELEFELSSCLGATLGDDHAALRALFRPRGEESRILIADALMRRKYADAKLGDQYDAMLGAIRTCKKVRNQYAHCHWFSDPQDGLFFMDLESAASSSALTTPDFTFHHVDAPLLRQQAEYFVYTFSILQFLWREYQVRGGKIPSHSFQMPRVLPKPPLHNPPDRHPVPSSLAKDAVAHPGKAEDNA